ncbi:hypothetical protein B296_00026028 [Ensete ventricosum]|uniref:Uncharacterized protein n=1 Tax=Ensete ventricosum TaxID=4639 RepID=A0A427ARE4_ENSVE|nr:hypothetical protein B296_00026028 [Ensete ventricosum]
MRRVPPCGARLVFHPQLSCAIRRDSPTLTCDGARQNNRRRKGTRPVVAGLTTLGPRSGTHVLPPLRLHA